MNPVFRWTVWGNKRHLAETLPCSVGTFRRAFGDSARYVVCTDEPELTKALLPGSTEIVPIDMSAPSSFHIQSKAKWQKWSPKPRLFPGSTEFFVDSDVFLVGDPEELRRFIVNDTGAAYIVLREAHGSGHWIGQFVPRILSGIPPINIGLFGQRGRADITEELMAELVWWQQTPRANHHCNDVQGAVTAILSRYYLIGHVTLLPQDRYRIVSPISNAHLESLRGTVAIHATHPNHPAFYRFRSAIEQYMSGSEK
jgi:hypothetical protein